MLITFAISLKASYRNPNTWEFTMDSLSIKTTLKDTIANDSLISKNALDKKVIYNADDSIVFDIIHQKVFLYGNAKVSYGDITLNAGFISFAMDSNLLKAMPLTDSSGNIIGKPVFTEDNESFTADTILYNFKTKKGKIINVLTKEYEGYVHGEQVKKMENDVLYIRDGKYTTCNLKNPHFYIESKKLKVIPDDKIISGPAYLVIEGVPTPLALPFGIFPNKKNHASGLVLPNYGESPNLGFYLLNGGYYWAINDYIDLQLTGDIYSKGSWGGKIYSNYKKRYKYSGSFNISYVYLKQGIKETPSFSLKKEYFIRWKHKQDEKAKLNSNFSVDINAGTISNFQNNFNTNTNDYLSNTFQSNIRYNKKFANTPFNLSTNLRHNQNSLTKAISFTLPELVFTMSRIYPLKRKNIKGKERWYEKTGINYTLKGKNEISTYDSLITADNISNLTNSSKNGFMQSIPLTTSMRLFKFFTLNPSFNLNQRFYFKTIRKKWDYNNNKIVTDTLYEIKAPIDYSFNSLLSTKIYGLYQFKKGKIKAFRHVMTPTIGINYIPKVDKLLTLINDSTGQKTSYSIYEGAIYGSPSPSDKGLITFQLINNLEMKVNTPKDTVKPLKKIKIFESLNLDGSYNLLADSLNLSPIKISGRTFFAKNVGLTFNGTLNPYAISNDGRTINDFLLSKNGKLARLTNATVSLTMQFKSKNKVKGVEKNESKYSKEELEDIEKYSDAYIDFSIPWSFNINYNINYSKISFDENIVQTLTFSGNISITPKWKIEVQSGYDFVNQKLSYTSINIYRDLHCWEMNAEIIPFGQRKSYSIEINVKASVLQDLKLSRKRYWYDF